MPSLTPKNCPVAVSYIGRYILTSFLSSFTASSMFSGGDLNAIICPQNCLVTINHGISIFYSEIRLIYIN